jgi:hypothetical protein
MFCPQCGTNQSDELKFCKSCGANLFAVRQVVAKRETGERFDWSKTWVAEMLLSQGERERRKEELELQVGITPEVKRQREMKAGVITASVGIGVAVFLFVLMQGIILGGEVGQSVAAILGRLWVVGVIPFCIGIGILISGLFFKSDAKATIRPNLMEREAKPDFLTSGEASRGVPSGFSVTDETTRHLSGADLKE